jgi:hypothetical protein
MSGGEYDVLGFIGVTEKAGMQNRGGGSAGSLSSYPPPFLLFKVVACFLLQSVEPEQRKRHLPIVRRPAAREQAMMSISTIHGKKSRHMTDSEAEVTESAATQKQR